MQEFRKAITYNIELAEAVEELLRKSPNWEVISPATLAVINFRFNPIDNDLTERELDTLNQYISGKVVDSQKALLVTTILHEQVVLRMCLINPRTTMADIRETLNLCSEFAAEYKNNK